GLWILLGLFAILLIAVIVISFWKVLSTDLVFRRRASARAENLFLPVDLLLNDPSNTTAGSLPSEKIYLRSIGFNRLVLLSEHPLRRGEDIWLSVKKVPYFHGNKEFIHARLRNS